MTDQPPPAESAPAIKVVQKRPRRPSDRAFIAKLAKGLPTEEAAALRLRAQGPDNYYPIARRMRLVGDGLKPTVYSDGRGNGAWENCCWYCGVTQTPMISEHMLPSSDGGSDDESNIVSACVRCNNDKRYLNVEGFRRYLERRSGVDTVVFAGEAKLCVLPGYRFAHVFVMDVSKRRRIVAASRRRKNPDPPPPPEWTPEEEAMIRGLL